jgi:hypothetical protein
MKIKILQFILDFLDRKIQKIYDEAYRKDNNIIFDQKRWSKVVPYQLKELRKKIDQKIRLNLIPKYSELSQYGDLMSVADFVKCVENGTFTNYDGYGCYVKDGKESQIEIYPSDVKSNAIRLDFQHVIWFNR